MNLRQREIIEMMEDDIIDREDSAITYFVRDCGYKLTTQYNHDIEWDEKIIMSDYIEYDIIDFNCLRDFMDSLKFRYIDNCIEFGETYQDVHTVMVIVNLYQETFTVVKVR